MKREENRREEDVREDLQPEKKTKSRRLWDELAGVVHGGGGDAGSED